jgi:hypothetical protein
MKVRMRTMKIANDHARFCRAWKWMVEVVGEEEAARMKNSVVPCPSLLPYSVCNSVPMPRGVG